MPPIRPVLQDEAFLADVRRARHDLDQVQLWWLGRSGFLVQWRGHHLLLDPYLSDALGARPGGSGPPRPRLVEPVVSPRRLNFVQAVAISHSHAGHLDRGTLLALLEVNPRLELIIPEASREAVVNRLGIPIELPRGLDAGRSCSVAGFVISAVPAAHTRLERDSGGRHRYLGYIIQAGPWTLYHAGDTVRYLGMETWLQRRPVDIALLPINGQATQPGEHDNLDGPQAAALGRDIGARLVIPCHHDQVGSEALLEAFVTAAQRLGQPYRLLQCGQQWSSAQFSARPAPAP